MNPKPERTEWLVQHNWDIAERFTIDSEKFGGSHKRNIDCNVVYKQIHEHSWWQLREKNVAIVSGHAARSLPGFARSLSFEPSVIQK